MRSSAHNLAVGLVALLACGDGAATFDAGSVADSGLDAATDAAGASDSSDAAGSDASSCRPPAGERSEDRWGGDARVELEATGRFRAEKLCERWWLVTPEGHPFWSRGVNHVTALGDAGRESGERPYAETVARIYANDEEWADTTVERLRSWGFDTAGAWSDAGLLGPRMAHTVNLQLSGADWQTGELADYFAPEFGEDVRLGVAERVTPWRDDPNLVGYFLDNEMKWGPDWRGPRTLLQTYLDLPAEAPGKQEAVTLLVDELGGLDGVNAVLGTAFATEDDLLAATDSWDALDAGESETEWRLTSTFLLRTAAQYFRVVTGEVREADGTHLILGNREVSVMTRAEVFLAAAPYVDAFSINSYVFVDGIAEAALEMSGGLDPADGFAALHALVDLPILVSEFGFRAADSGLPNSWPPIYPTYETQDERAEAFATYSRSRQAITWIVGHHWFEWVDQPAEGRFDGEDNNWGLVDVQDQPYAVLTDRMAEIHAEIWESLQVSAVE